MSIEKPLIDIFVPTYEPDPHFLTHALDSIKHQTERRFSVFINDDCSQGDVKEWVKPYLADGRFTFTRSAKRLGIGGNWNACLSYGSAPYMQFLFQDDYWYTPYLQRCLEIFTQYPSIGFISVDHMYEYEEGTDNASTYESWRTLRRTHIAPGIHRGMHFLRWWIDQGLHPNMIGEPSFVMMKRDVVERTGLFREDMAQSLDVEYWTRILQKTDWHFLDEELGAFRVHTKGASAKNQREGMGLFERFQCLNHLAKTMPEAGLARDKTLVSMVTKFFGRIADRKKVSTKGSGEFRRFCLRHPLVVMKALLRSMLSFDRAQDRLHKK